MDRKMGKTHNLADLDDHITKHISKILYNAHIIMLHQTQINNLHKQINKLYKNANQCSLILCYIVDSCRELRLVENILATTN